ncbi:MAG: hypothetical protein AAGF12_23745 [Myxococcota bacterium]
MNKTLRPIVAALVLCLVGCGGSEPAPAYIPPPGNAEATAVRAGPVSISGDRAAVGAVGRAGGTFTLSNGARLEIPRGALEEEIDLTFGVGSETRAFNNRENLRLVGPSLMAMPGVESAGDDFTIVAPVGSLPSGYDESDLRLAVEVQDDQQRGFSAETTATFWEYLPAELSGNSASADLPILPGERFQFVLSGSVAKP